MLGKRSSALTLRVIIFQHDGIQLLKILYDRESPSPEFDEFFTEFLSAKIEIYPNQRNRNSCLCRNCGLLQRVCFRIFSCSGKRISNQQEMLRPFAARK